jgi:hypothetical protein
MVLATAVERPKPGQVNKALLLALASKQADGRPHWKIASDAEIHPTQLSLFLNGHRTPSLPQAERIAAAVGESVGTLFPYLDSEHAREGDPERVQKTTDDDRTGRT